MVYECTVQLMIVGARPEVDPDARIETFVGVNCKLQGYHQSNQLQGRLLKAKSDRYNWSQGDVLQRLESRISLQIESISCRHD